MEFHIVMCKPDEHATAVREIFNDAILHTTALYDYKPWSRADVLQWFGAKAKSGFPVIAAVDPAGVLLGFASYGQFRARPAYKLGGAPSTCTGTTGDGGRTRTAEAADRAGPRAAVHVMVGGIDVSNAESVALHEQLGFRHVGTISEAGYKFGRWLDLAFYQLTLPTPGNPADG
jgi:phosphinothricin acetyltransferase